MISRTHLQLIWTLICYWTFWSLTSLSTTFIVCLTMQLNHGLLLFFLSFQYRPQHPLWWNWRVSYSTMTLDSMAIVKHHISFRTSYYNSHSLDVVITVADTSVSCYLLQHTVTIWSLSHFISIQHVFRSDIMHYVIAFYKIYHYWAVSQIILSWTLLIQPPSTMAELVDCYSSTSVYCCA